MIPLTFCLGNALELLSDAERRSIGDKARADADANIVDPPKVTRFYVWNVWDQKHAMEMHRVIYYDDVRSKRVARRVRKAMEDWRLSEKNTA